MKTPVNNQTNPWSGIWVKPRETIRTMIERNPRRWIILLAVVNGLISGLAWALSLSTNYPERDVFKQGWFLGVLLLVGILIGVVSLYIASWLYKVTGRWIGGKGSYEGVKCAVGWSYYPYLIANFFGILNTLTLKIPLVSLLFGLISIVLLVWAFIISLKMIGEAHEFSAWRALACVFIASVLVFLVLLVLLLVIPLLKPLFAT